MKAKNKKNLTDDLLKTVHRNERNAEIAAFGKTINHNKVVASKKVYSRKEKHRNSFE